jgi:hypothetical protein
MCSPITGMCTRGRAAAHVNKLGITDLIGGSIPTPGGATSKPGFPTVNYLRHLAQLSRMFFAL